MVYNKSDTLHLHYDLEKPGYQGFERRHYPEKHRFTISESVYKPRGRAHIPSPPLEEVQWRPHGHHIEPVYSNVGPDWHSRLRYIPSPCNPTARPTLPVGLIERNVQFVRPFPQNWQRTTKEWLYFNDEAMDKRSSKRNLFGDVHFRSLEDLGNEDVHMIQIGHKKQVFDARNGLGQRSDGDKSYRRVELSPDFHKLGSTLPAVDFGRVKKRHGPAKSYVPMKDDVIPIVDERDFELKELKREQDELVNEVVQLDQWKPAESVKTAFKVFDLDANGKIGGRYRPRFR